MKKRRKKIVGRIVSGDEAERKAVELGVHRSLREAASRAGPGGCAIAEVGGVVLAVHLPGPGDVGDAWVMATGIAMEVLLHAYKQSLLDGPQSVKIKTAESDPKS